MIYELLLKPYESYETHQIILEIVAVFFGLLSVYFSIKKNIWVYPTGIISTVLFIYIMYVFGLLGDFIINIYYTCMSIYGWILWSKNKEDNTHVKIEYATRKDWIFCIFLFITSIIFVTLVYYYKPLLDNQFILKNTKLGLQYLDWANWLDILTTALFLIGMYLMANRKIENWIFWIIADIISVPMLIYKELIITSFQFFIFTIMAIIGYISWKKTLNSPIKKIV